MIMIRIIGIGRKVIEIGTGILMQGKMISRFSQRIE